MVVTSSDIFPFNVLNKETANRMRVLMIAYAYSPSMGSEYRHAWELSHELSKHHDLTLLFGDSDGRMGSFNSYDQYQAKNKDSVYAIKVEVSLVEKAIARLMLRMPFSLFFAFLLRFWHIRAFKIAKALHADQPFDVVHQLGPIGFRNPGYCWKLDTLTYWGPIGGAQYVNLKMVRRKFSLYFFEALIRNIDVSLKRLSPYVRNAALRFDRLSFATPENKAYFGKFFMRDGEIISDQGLRHDTKHELFARKRGKGLVVAWGGTLNARKNIDLLIAIAERCPIDIEFRVMGDGPMRDVLEHAADQNPRIKVLGHLERVKVQEVLDGSDAILLTSLSEANTAILFEGIENGCIPIAPKINGFSACLNDSFAVIYPNENWDNSISAAVKGLRELLQSEILAQKRASLKREISNLTWRALAQKHMRYYE